MKDLLLIDMHKVFASDNKTLVPLTFPVRHGTAFACAKLGTKAFVPRETAGDWLRLKIQIVGRAGGRVSGTKEFRDS